ncbi:hypothetical protein BVX98_04735 [bacterium F11]|nr:hypothetical protein BVX98_04735 [bacterium F11]
MRYFTVQEAEELIPALKGIIRDAQEIKLNIEAKVEEWRRTHKSMGPAEEAVIRGQIEYLAKSMESKLNEMTEMGCILKDLDLGLTDFPARIGEKEAYLCWRSGEENIRFWHGITEGYSGRKPLEKEDVLR